MTLVSSWRANGSPVSYAQPIRDLAAVLRRRGYSVGIIGNDSHLNADRPEDHTPFSVTGWPLPNPYPWVHALDIMPAANLPSLGRLGKQIAADRSAGLPGASWIKYMNWTPTGGSCRHESWQPDHAIVPSSDAGHIHISCRTDFTRSTIAMNYDPVARLLAGVTGASSVPVWPGRYLKLGMSGDDVRRYQQRMHDRGWTVTVDGDFGPQSDAMTRAFQTEKGLSPVDGVVGPATWTKVFGSPIT